MFLLHISVPFRIHFSDYYIVVRDCGRLGLSPLQVQLADASKRSCGLREKISVPSNGGTGKSSEATDKDDYR